LVFFLWGVGGVGLVGGWWGGGVCFLVLGGGFMECLVLFSRQRGGRCLGVSWMGWGKGGKAVMGTKIGGERKENSCLDWWPGSGNRGGKRVGPKREEKVFLVVFANGGHENVLAICGRRWAMKKKNQRGRAFWWDNYKRKRNPPRKRDAYIVRNIGGGQGGGQTKIPAKGAVMVWSKWGANIKIPWRVKNGKSRRMGLKKKNEGKKKKGGATPQPVILKA